MTRSHRHRGKRLYTRYLAETDIALGVGDRGHSSPSEPPRTLEEAFNGFQERNLGISE